MTNQQTSGEDQMRAFAVPRGSRPLYAVPSESWHSLLTKAKTPNDYARSNQDNDLFPNSVKPWPFDLLSVKKFLNHNEHHSTCVLTKARATCGLGFKTPSEIKKSKQKQGDIEAPEPAETEANERSRVSEVLDGLCRTTFKDVLDASIEDYHNIGNGYIELVRDESYKITGIHFLPGESVWIKEERTQIFYEIRPADGGVQRYFAPFGERDAVVDMLGLSDRRETVSEVIHFPKTSSLSRWYGYPDWLSATASVELVQMITQNHFDYHNNRGVPEFFAIFKGTTLDKATWETIESKMVSTVGLGNAYKSLALNIPNPSLEVEVIKLAMEGKSPDTFAEQLDALAYKIVTAHRVPPLLAGIQVPGKLGATNELPNALKAFQTLVIGPAQDSITTILHKTLGDASLNGGLGLNPDDFQMRTILDVIDVGETDTIARMRQTLPEAQAEGRDLSAGLKKSLDAMNDSEKRSVMADAVASVLLRMVRA